MRDRPDHPRQLGHIRLVRELPDACVGQRWVGLHEHHRTNHLVYRLPVCRDRGERRDMLELLEQTSAIRHPHLLAIEQYTLARDGSAWVVAPYTGSQAGLVTLNDLLEAKGGTMPPFESERTLEHLLSGVALAHDAGVVHGPALDDELLVDRHGRLLIELYGLRRGLRYDALGAGREDTRDEIRSIVQLGYRLLTGLHPDEPMLPASRIVKRLEKRWDAWFERGLDPTDGFDSAATALEALRSGETTTGAPVVRAKSVLGRLGWVGLGPKRQGQ